MSKPSYLTKSITIRGIDGNDIRVSEAKRAKAAERAAKVVEIPKKDTAA